MQVRNSSSPWPIMGWLACLKFLKTTVFSEMFSKKQSHGLSMSNRDVFYWSIIPGLTCAWPVPLGCVGFPARAEEEFPFYNISAPSFGLGNQDADLPWPIYWTVLGSFSLLRPNVT